MKIKHIIKLLLPTFIVLIYRCCKKEKYGFKGRYLNYNEAKKHSDIYDSDYFVDKVKQAVLKVKAGEAIFERDSVLMNFKDYPYPLITTVLRIASENNNNINVIDFGGSLGSSYFQCYDFISNINIKWNVVELPKFVECGKKYIEDDIVRFYDNIDECVSQNNVDLLILSGVVNFMPEPYMFLEDINKYNFRYIYMSYIIFEDEDKDIITIDNFNPNIYNAKIPCWLLSYTKFINTIEKQYSIIASFEQPYKDVVYRKSEAKRMGFILKLK